MSTRHLSIREHSLSDFQQLNRTIYLVENDRNYNAMDMVSRMKRYATRVLKAVRKDRPDTIPRDLCMGFSWAMALGNRFHLNLEEETWIRFPGVCPYCASIPCRGAACKTMSQERKRFESSIEDRPTTLSRSQKMFREIYPFNSLQDAAMHLAEETGEMGEAIEEFMGTHSPSLFIKIVEELVDVVTNQLAVASCIDVDLAVEMEKIFGRGCPEPGCLGVPCTCGFIIHAEGTSSIGSVKVSRM